MYIFIVNNGLPLLYPATKLFLFFSKGDDANEISAFVQYLLKSTVVSGIV